MPGRLSVVAALAACPAVDIMHASRDEPARHSMKLLHMEHVRCDICSSDSTA